MTVIHDEARHRFVVELPGGEGELRYRLPGPGLVDLLHTEVTPALRGQGVANALVEAAVAWVRERGSLFIPTCPFVQKWLDRHPEALDLVTVRPPRPTG